MAYGKARLSIFKKALHLLFEDTGSEVDGNVESVKTYEFAKPISDEVSFSVVYIGLGFTGLLAIIFLVFAVILRKRRILAEMEVIDDWGVFASDESDALFEK